jgi:hypothetical protein
MMLSGVQLMTEPVEGAGDHQPGDIVRDFNAARAARAGELPPLRGSRRADRTSAERIQRLKEQIARGEYKPDPEEIARKLLESGF